MIANTVAKLILSTITVTINHNKLAIITNHK